MTNTEAISIIKNTPIYRYDEITGRSSDLFTALKMGVLALEKEEASSRDETKKQRNMEIESSEEVLSERESEINAILNIVIDLLSESNLALYYDKNKKGLAIYDSVSDKRYIILDK